MNSTHDSTDNVLYIHRDPLFERCLEALRNKGGEGAVAAKKADEFISSLAGNGSGQAREKFSFTRNGEARIRNCRKIDLGSGYRLVCLLKDSHLVLLYAGSHDECSRWLMRNRGMRYEIGEKVLEIPVSRDRRDEPDRDCERHDELFPESYEAELMSRIDDAVLRKIFSGLVDR
jgi:hypothetical protein